MLIIKFNYGFQPKQCQCYMIRNGNDFQCRIIKKTFWSKTYGQGKQLEFIQASAEVCAHSHTFVHAALAGQVNWPWAGLMGLSMWTGTRLVMTKKHTWLVLGNVFVGMMERNDCPKNWNTQILMILGAFQIQLHVIGALPCVMQRRWSAVLILVFIVFVATLYA